VVIFRSRVTDTRRMRDWLRTREVEYREVEMPMGQSESRERFHDLRRLTGWDTLPQVYINGDFVGGEPEFFHHRFVSGEGDETPSPISQGELDPVRKILGYAGLIPFVAGMLAIALLTDAGIRRQVELMLIGYGAVILSFLGAVHWGRLVAAPALGMVAPLAMWSVVPSLLGWASLLLPFSTAAPALALLFAAVYLVDRVLLGERDAPEGYMTMRLHLTVVVVLSLLVSWVVA
jgi:hypothetical protein